MKWFAHDSNLRNTPYMRGIVAELGKDGYACALLMLEVLAENGGMSKDFCPDLRLNKPQSDVSFWAREFQLPLEETNRYFDVFEKYELIVPRKGSGGICAPMLSDCLDDWSKRKRAIARQRN
jgi:hypothetical protein